MGSIHFWFPIGSTYTFFAVMRLPRIAEEAGVEFHWRPFNSARS